MPNANRIVWERDLLLRMYMYTSIKHSTAAMVFGTVNFIVQASDWFALWRHTTIERERASEYIFYQTIVILLKWYLNYLESMPFTSININPRTISGSDWRKCSTYFANRSFILCCYKWEKKDENCAWNWQSSEMQLKYYELLVLFQRECGRTRAVPHRWILIKVWCLKGHSMFTFHFWISCSILLFFSQNEKYTNMKFPTYHKCINPIYNVDCQPLTQVMVPECRKNTHCTERERER